ncbi:MAG: anti-sigma factor, partial [Gordonia sp. (in: high G+C Gram-positive bacteria)]|uniref:anti-sigma factor n=1 Tax=Gordonia sp. (in: high G+C Gram-positive bacteria) TaxID=84139 RepID=UPI003BB72F14
IVLGAGGAVLGYSIAGRDAPASTSPADQIFAAPDVRTTSGEVAGGRATVTYSPATGEGILVMNQVPQPAPGTIYQMWLDGPSGSRLAGTMSESDVAPSTTAIIHDMSGATAVTFTVGNAAEPTVRVGEPVASLPLS